MTYSQFSPTNFLDLFTYVNTESAGIFGYGVLLTIFILTFISMKQWTTERALLGSATMTFIISILTSVIGLTNYSVIAVCFIIMIGALVLNKGE